MRKTDIILNLDEQQWAKVWTYMCVSFGYVLAGDEYNQFYNEFGCVDIIIEYDKFVKMVFQNSEDAVAFKLGWL